MEFLLLWLIMIKNKKFMPALALMCALLWALAYPFIKLGYQLFNIEGNDLGSKILFAGLRFFFAGVLVLLTDRNFKTAVRNMSRKGWRALLIFTMVNITLHYLFSYTGLGYIPGSRGTVLDSTSTFITVILSAIVFSDDRMSGWKALGCLLGFSGILLINVNGSRNFFDNISFMGDGMILLNAFCGAMGSITGRFASKYINMMTATGVSMCLGGTVLIVIGIIIRPDRAWNFSIEGLLVLSALILISTVSFTVYNSLIAIYPVSNVAIFNSFIPIFGVIFSSLVLGEPLKITYLLAGVLAAFGTRLTNKGSKEKDNI
jgi:drug/metabolite transporter (DMT)-like permease